MSIKIAITTSTFAQYDLTPMKLLEAQGCSVTLNRLGRTLNEEETIQLLKGCIAVIAGTEAYTEKVLKSLTDLCIISRCGSGMDNIDLAFCRERGIKVFNTPVGPEQAVAELVIGLALNLLRHVGAQDQALRKGSWEKKMGVLFSGKKVGIIGFGRIGREVGRLSHQLGAQVMFCDPLIKSSPVSWAEQTEFENLLSQCDIITLHVPLNDSTKNIISSKEFDLFKKDAILINCARGGLVDEQALYERLKDKKLAGAALDVFAYEPYQGPLTTLENVILTPHIGAYAKEVRVQMEKEAVENLIKGLKTINNSIQGIKR